MAGHFPTNEASPRSGAPLAATFRYTSEAVMKHRNGRMHVLCLSFRHRPTAAERMHRELTLIMNACIAGGLTHAEP